MAKLIESLDAKLDELFSGWNILSTVLILLLTAFVLYPILTAKDPDTHPLLLSRQSNISEVRQPGESARYRSLEIPHGYPLKSGLNVRDQGMSKYLTGRDGDTRDIWRKVVTGEVDEDSNPLNKRGKLLTVYGKEEVEEHALEEVSKQINAIGTHLKKQGAKTVAIYLPNSVELMVSVFACAFYGLHPVLIPYDQSAQNALKIIPKTGADCLIAAAGVLPLEELKSRYSDLQHAVYVVEKSSKQMDWSEEGASVWHDVAAEDGTTSSELPTETDSKSVPELAAVFMNDTASSGEIVSFSQGNIVSATAAAISAIPTRQRLSQSDLFFPADSLSSPYVLIQTFAALYCNASVVFNSVAGPNVDLSLATRGISPTVITASAASALKLHQTTSKSITSNAKKMALRAQNQALEAGYMPVDTLLTKLNAPHVASMGTEPGKLRLLLTYERVNAGTPPLSPRELSDLRAFTGARVVYALTAPKVAGAVTQTTFYDYRMEAQSKGAHSHFGVPLSSVELKVVDSGDYKTTDEKTEGEVVANGPAVLGGEADLGFIGRFRDDGTLAYVK